MRKVLVVEDSASARAFVRAVLEEEAFAQRLGGCEVVEATCGFDAMRLLPRGPFDLIVTDINMPDINGLELIRFVRQNNHLGAVALLVISTQSSERDRARSLALGADEFLAKPFAPEQLVSAVVKCLSARRSTSKPPAHDGGAGPKLPPEGGV
jgi:two-component system chemotaxis response regulator CheY